MKWIHDTFGDGDVLKIGRFKIKVFRINLTKDRRNDPEPYGVMMNADFKLDKKFTTRKEARAAGIERAKTILRTALKELNEMEVS